MNQEREHLPAEEISQTRFDLPLPSGTELKTGPYNDSEPSHLRKDLVLSLFPSSAPGWLETSLEEKTYHLPTEAAISVISEQLEKALEETEGIKPDTSIFPKKLLEAQSSLVQIERTAKTLQEIIKLFPLGGNGQEILEKEISEITSRFDELT